MCHLSTLAIELNLVLFQLAKTMQATYRALVELIHSYVRKSGIISEFQCDQFLPGIVENVLFDKAHFFSPAEEFRISPRQKPHPRQAITPRGLGDGSTKRRKLSLAGEIDETLPANRSLCAFSPQTPHRNSSARSRSLRSPFGLPSKAARFGSYSAISFSPRKKTSKNPAVY